MGKCLLHKIALFVQPSSHLVEKHGQSGHGISALDLLEVLENKMSSRDSSSLSSLQQTCCKSVTCCLKCIIYVLFMYPKQQEPKVELVKHYPTRGTFRCVSVFWCSTRKQSHVFCIQSFKLSFSHSFMFFCFFFGCILGNIFPIFVLYPETRFSYICMTKVCFRSPENGRCAAIMVQPSASKNTAHVLGRGPEANCGSL